MSGVGQGVPQRMTAFVDPRSGVMTPAWYRFFYTIWERTGGAPATSTIDDVIETLKMSDVTPAANPGPAAWLGAILGDVVPASNPEPAAWLGAALGDVVPASNPEPAAWLGAAMGDVGTPANPEAPAWLGAALGDVVTPMQTESAVWQAVSAGDIPRVPENDPMMISLMVA